eukprot:10516423-Alexandrium_andersonii.AAC.1
MDSMWIALGYRLRSERVSLTGRHHLDPIHISMQRSRDIPSGIQAFDTLETIEAQPLHNLGGI